MEVADAITMAILSALIKKRLAIMQARYTLVFGELTQWIHRPQIIGHGGAIENTSYLAKGFSSIRFKDESDVSKILKKGPLLFNRTV